MTGSKGFTPRSVKRPRMQVEEQLREAIASGQLPQGEKLPSEAALAELFGVSRATVREALRSLASAGLIRTQPGAVGGSFVQRVGPDELSEMIASSMRSTLALGTIDRDEALAVRRMLEIPAARLAARNRTEEDLAAIRDVLEDEAEGPGFEARFGSAVARAAHNNVLTALISALRDVARDAADPDQAPAPGHGDLLRAVADGDPDAAEEAVRRQLDDLVGPALGRPAEARAKAARPKAGVTRRPRATRAS